MLDGVAGVDELFCGYDVASELPNMTENVEADGSQRQREAAASEAGKGGAVIEMAQAGVYLDFKSL